jgi:hypothetical protein
MAVILAVLPFNKLTQSIDIDSTDISYDDYSLLFVLENKVCPHLCQLTSRHQPLGAEKILVSQRR